MARIISSDEDTDGLPLNKDLPYSWHISDTIPALSSDTPSPNEVVSTLHKREPEYILAISLSCVFVNFIPVLLFWVTFFLHHIPSANPVNRKGEKSAVSRNYFF